MNDAPLYQGYDQAGLDAQYNNRARVPEHADIHAGYQAQADAVLADFDTRLDVSYGPSAEETLDISLPKPAPPASTKEGAPAECQLTFFSMAGIGSAATRTTIVSWPAA